jgi:hypothetical protein
MKTDIYKKLKTRCQYLSCESCSRQRSEAAMEIARLRDALRFIAEFGGNAHETELGTINCDGAWCADQARAALPLEDLV